MPQSAAVKTRVVVATSVMLSFISFWRAAAIVLNDLASTAYYIGGIAEEAIGKAAPWFVLAIMLFSYAVRAVYIESCSMFVRGGVYRVVHEALGGTLAKLSVSALMFDYVLTGPISGVSAGLYMAALINELAELGHLTGVHVNPQRFAVVFAIGVTLYFWRKNIIGIPESSQKALRIMQITTVMVVILICWCLLTVWKVGFQSVPAPIPANLHFSDEALGWLKGTALPSLPGIAILIALGHSLLAMSGEESMAQVYREIAFPKLKNLKRAAFVIFVFSLVFTGFVSFFAVMVVPDAARGRYLDNLIGGLSMFLVGPLQARLLFHAFVVLTGTLILSGAVNTSLIGSNGVLNRVAEDGVLPDWFRHPHRRFGTTHRLINGVTGLQLLTILISRGDVYLLGEAYAFGVMWSFFMKALSVLVLRYKRPNGREWKVPFNVQVRGVEIPIGLGVITVGLFLLAAVNLLTKKAATISGLTFTLVFFAILEVSERYRRRIRQARPGQEEEKFLVAVSDDISIETVGVRRGCILVGIRNPDRLYHLKKVLDKTDTRKIDLVAVSVRLLQPGVGEHALAPDQIFARDEVRLFSRVIELAETAGKPVKLLTVPATNGSLALLHVAAGLRASRVVVGRSERMSIEAQARAARATWETLPQPRPALSVEIVISETDSRFYDFGPHPPRLWPEDMRLTHALWLELTKRFGDRLHHRDIIGVALRRFAADLESRRAGEVLEAVEHEIGNRTDPPVAVNRAEGPWPNEI
jgi:amino acid transporter